MIFQHDGCEKYLSEAKESNEQIIENLEKVITSLGVDKAELFLSTAARVLKESAEKLVLSVESNDADLFARSAHKLRGSSNLYASEKLMQLLREAVDSPEVILGDEKQTSVLICEFELVLENINKISQKLRGA